METCDILLYKVAKYYLRGSLNFTLEPNDLECMTWDWQQKFLDVTVKNELLKQYPLSCTFSKLFMKKLIKYLDLLNQEIHDEIYTHLCQYMSSEQSANSFCYRHHIIGSNLSEVISIKETNKMVVDGTTGMRTWEAALMLADWALCNKEIFQNNKILELGSGVGFTGVTIAKHCSPQTIYLTDCHSGVLGVICDNIRINFPQIQEEQNNDETVFRIKGQTIGTMILDWNAVENLHTSTIPDIIIGADIVYDPIIIQPLCDVLKAFFDRNEHLNVYIASVIRNKDTLEAFLNSLGAMDFICKELSLNESVFIDWDQNAEMCLLQINCIPKLNADR